VITAWIGLGSNVGDRVHFIATAIEELSALETTRVVKHSSLFETSPVKVGGGAFINSVARIETQLPARELLRNLLALEKNMGRERTPGTVDPRVIDLDLLLYGEERIEEPELTLPHPRMIGRRFVMEPLAELDPEISIPGTGLKTARIAQDLAQSDPDQRVERVGTLDSLASGQPRQALDQSSPENL
jgi:2-amino-4-hydroxy-6-hydroxymethyldihydropteridine diphosphokinase